MVKKDYYGKAAYQGVDGYDGLLVYVQLDGAPHGHEGKVDQRHLVRSPDGADRCRGPAACNLLDE